MGQLRTDDGCESLAEVPLLVMKVGSVKYRDTKCVLDGEIIYALIEPTGKRNTSKRYE